MSGHGPQQEEGHGTPADHPTVQAVPCGARAGRSLGVEARPCSGTSLLEDQGGMGEGPADFQLLAGQAAVETPTFPLLTEVFTASSLQSAGELGRTGHLIPGCKRLSETNVAGNKNGLGDRRH